MITKQKFINEFLIYFNDYLTVEKFAEHRQISIEEACFIIDTGKKYHEEQFGD